ncbi:MAG: DNA cytosine methyltransferase [Candidatus Aenigmarchaeota archaeon]|nr:DNA cytosine methyltransferase [Candidatus Aenigmarchaeota archaeon]
MRIISLFSGAGGLDLGFKKAGAKIVWANDIDKDHGITYKHNVGDIVVEDIKKINVEDIPDADMIIGGFPCLGFTVAKGKYRKVNDDYNFLYKEYLRVLRYKKPSYFLIENVPGMIRGEQFKRFFDNMISEFESAGYNVKIRILNAADYGVPQKRKRVIILGVAKGIDKELAYPTPTHADPRLKVNLEPWITIREAIGDLPLEECNNIPNHVATKHKVKVNNFLGNRVLKWNEPAPTIMGRGSRTGGPVIHPHPELHRRLSVRECARLQSFPDDFIFYGSTSSMYAQVGDAVPPLLAFRIAQSVLSSTGYNYKKFRPEEWKLPWVKRIPSV